MKSIWKNLVAVLGVFGSIAVPAAPKNEASYQLNDSHFHLTDYAQEGLRLTRFLELMGNRVGRVALFGIPLQQQWSARISGSNRPGYYLETDAPLYYYSFTDAVIATEYLSLEPKQRERFDPMITGFNPADMYAADHVKRVLLTFPGVFVGIGEFSVHKEFVTSKVAGEVPSLLDPALDRLFRLADEAGLVVLIHNDVTTPFPKESPRAAYLEQLESLFLRHPGVSIIWAHAGLGRVIEPVPGLLDQLDAMLSDSRFDHVSVDLSWTETAKYIVATPQTVRATARIINRHPGRFLFGTDAVAPKSARDYLEVYDQYAPLWKLLTPEARTNVLKANHERLFDRARQEVRAWERAQLAAKPGNGIAQALINCGAQE